MGFNSAFKGLINPPRCGLSNVYVKQKLLNVLIDCCSKDYLREQYF
jgi:hypothetical protein